MVASTTTTTASVRPKANSPLYQRAAILAACDASGCHQRMRTFRPTRVRTLTRSKGAWVRSLGADIITLIVGLAICANVRLVGSIPGSELVLIPVLPVLLVSRFKKIRQGTFEVSFLLLGLWLRGQIATDIYRGTDLSTGSSGDSSIVFMGIDLALSPLW